MKKIGFIGGYDKSDLIIYVSKILKLLGNSVMVIDTTLMQKSKYIVPSINPTKAYVTSFEDIDFAIGFEDWIEIKKYLGMELEFNKNEFQYDYILIDIDSEEMFKSYEMNDSYRNFFVTGFDMYSIKKGLSIFENLQFPAELIKIMFTYDISKEEEEYLDTISLNYNINWKNDFKIYFTILDNDNRVIQENQRLEKIRFRNLSSNYKESIAYIVQEIDSKNGIGAIKKLMKD